MQKLLEHLTHCGIQPNIRHSERRKIIIMNYWNLAAAAVQVPYIFTALHLGEMNGFRMNTLFMVLAVIGYLFSYKGFVRLSRYWMIILFPMMLTLLNMYFGRESLVITIYVLMALAVPFFFDKKREILWMGGYVIAIAIFSHYISREPLVLQEWYVKVVFSNMNIVTSTVLTITFVRILQKENLDFEENIIQQNTMLSQQKEEIEAQRDQLSNMNHEISHQNETLNASNQLIARKNKTITDSIRYAERIQTAMMPSEAELKSLFPQSFIIYKPKDIIGGDFYWAEKTADAIFWAVADCTGHGVPGALMSMLGANLLSQILAHTQEPSQILAELDAQIRKQLRQDEATSDIRDGMDIAVCRLDSQQLLVASAQRPMLIATKNGTFQRIKGDKNPIGSGIYQQKTFTTHAFRREEVAGVYLYTDGCTDLFDATNTRKVSQKRWLEWLEEVADLPVEKQELTMKEKLDAWAGSTPPIDDLLLVCVRFAHP